MKHHLTNILICGKFSLVADNIMKTKLTFPQQRRDFGVDGVDVLVVGHGVTSHALERAVLRDSVNHLRRQRLAKKRTQVLNRLWQVLEEKAIKSLVLGSALKPRTVLTHGRDPRLRASLGPSTSPSPYKDAWAPALGGGGFSLVSLMDNAALPKPRFPISNTHITPPLKPLVRKY